ncbi:hypothetical protein D3C87_853060 [compost metagenome]
MSDIESKTVELLLKGDTLSVASDIAKELKDDGDPTLTLLSNVILSIVNSVKTGEQLNKSFIKETLSNKEISEVYSIPEDLLD